MAEAEYQKKLESLQKYIPFLANMMQELKAKGNREAQLNKIQSLHDMITDKRKKLKIETLTRCEEVLTNIYFKVNPQLRNSKGSIRPASPNTLPGIESPRSTPQSPSPPRDIVSTTPVTIPTEKVTNPSKGFSSRNSPKANRPRVDVYSNVVIRSPTKVKTPIISAKVPDMSKPPISLDDLKTLEDDVQQKICDAAFVNKSVDELQEVKKQLQLQLRVEQVTTVMGMDKPTEPVNTTVRNSSMLTKKSHEGKSRSNESKKESKFEKKRNKAKENDGIIKGVTSHKPSKNSVKDIDMFGNLLSSIDDKLLEEKKKSKKADRRSSLSKEDSGSSSSLLSDKGDNKEAHVKKSKDKGKESSKHRRQSFTDSDQKKDEDKSKAQSQYDNKDKISPESTDKLISKKEIHYNEDPKSIDKKDEQNSKDIKDKDERCLKSDDTLKVDTDSSSSSRSSSEININCSDPLKSEPSLKTQGASDVSSMSKSLSESMDSNNTVYKRLADKYKPKPKQKAVDTDIPDVDAAVSKSIENLMKASPVKSFLRPLEQIPSAVGGNQGNMVASSEQNKPVQLPDILQRIFSKPLLGGIIPKGLNESIGNSSQNRFQNVNNAMTKPGIETTQSLVLSPPPQPLQFQAPQFTSGSCRPDAMLSPDSMGRLRMLPSQGSGHGILPTPGPGHGILQTPGSGLGMLPTPPVPPNIPTGFLDNGMGYSTPRMDFETPGTPMPDFDSSRMEFEPPSYLRNDGFNMNQRFVPPISEHQMRGFDPRNAAFMGRGRFTHQVDVNTVNPYDLTHGAGSYYASNQMPLVANAMPPYMPDSTFYQERARWARDRRPGDPRNYREYKELKERQEREAKVAQEKQKEIKDPRLAPRDKPTDTIRDPRLGRDPNIEEVKDKSEVTTRDPRLSKGREQSVERSKDIGRFKDKKETDSNRDRGPRDSRDRARSRDTFKDQRVSKESRSREKPDSNKFDKMYSLTNRARSRSRSRGREDRSEDDEPFTSPLDSLYGGEKGKTGRGYGVQNFRIPRKSRKDDEKRTVEKREDRPSRSGTPRRRVIQISDSEDSDTNDVNAEPVSDNGSDIEDNEKQRLEKDVDNKTGNKKGTNEDTAKKNDAVSNSVSRLKVVIQSGMKDNTDKWEPSEMDDFISEYDREFQNKNEDNPSRTTIKTRSKSNNHISEEGSDVSKTNSPEKLVSQNTAKNTANKEANVQIEEPSSSQDVEETPPDSASSSTIVLDVPTRQQDAVTEDTGNKSTDHIESDNSRRSDGVATPQETFTKNDEPSEQNILAHFFENLLKSRNKKDKKTALFSLIETFSDSFDDREIQKIRKIINVEEDVDEATDDEKEETTSSLENQLLISHDHHNAQEEQPIVGSTTGEELDSIGKQTVLNDAEATVEESSLVNETQVNEVTKSTDGSVLQNNADAKTNEDLPQSKDSDLLSSLEPVMVSVGERIKKRKRIAIPSKPRKKFKSELDLLHEDIQDMFIRDGVLTATGKRMCRILKDDPNALVSSNETTPTSVEEQPKKVRKKPGPKPKIKVSNQETVSNSMKDMRVVIRKMPDDVLNVSAGHTRQLRSRNRQSSYAETDDEVQENTFDEVSLTDSFDAGSDKSDLEAESQNESEDEKNSTNTEDTPKPKLRRRKVPKWASGIIPKIPKWKKKKTQQNKSKENSPERTISPVSSNFNDIDLFSDLDMDKLVEPDREYYYDYLNKRKIPCKLCKYSGHLLTGHYLKEHPQSEVLCSRFPPQVAADAIKDFTENAKLFESIGTSKITTKYHYSCRMCGYNTFVSPIFFYEHITTHTGEYRHQCGICEYVSVTSKTMGGHFAATHPEQERKTIKKSYTLAIVFAYMCGECNFVQLKEKNVEDHANIFHLGEKPIIYKINMSTTIDTQLTQAESLKAIDPKINEDNPITRSSPVKIQENIEPEIAEGGEKQRKKRGPKPKIALTENSSLGGNKKSNKLKSPLRKGPGSKSKTLPAPENDAANLDNNPPPVPMRKKPGPKSKTQQPILTAKETLILEESGIQDNKKEVITLHPEVTSSATSPVEGPAKDVGARKRKRSLDKLIPDDSRDDLDTIITLSSRISRAAKEKATAKLKTLMENNDGSPVKRKTDTDSPKKAKDISVEKNDQNKEAVKEVGDANNKQTEGEQTESIGDVPEKENNHQVEAMHPPSMTDEASEPKERDLNVFTCKNDILQEDAKKIQEDRLRKMDELNKSITSRTLKLDFVNKLSDRLNNERPSSDNISVQIKKEPSNNIPLQWETSMLQVEKGIPDPVVTETPGTLKVDKVAVVSKKPVFESEPVVRQPNIKFRQNKPNSLFSNMIEKLQGKVNEAAVQQDDTTTSIDSSTGETSCTDSQTLPGSEIFIMIGDLVRATKSDKEVIYSCHAGNCYVATKDKMVFQLHCKFGHKDLNLKSSLCDKCGVVIDVTPDTTLLENLYDHLVFAHSDFIGNSSNLRMRRLSGDKLSVKKENEALLASNSILQDFEDNIDRHVLACVPGEGIHMTTTHQSPPDMTTASMDTELPTTEVNEESANLELAEDNPFSFKIASVMSLAESDDNQGTQTSPIKSTPNAASKPPTLPLLKLVPPLTFIGSTPKQQPPQSLVVKEAKLTTTELNRPKKAPKALQKFIETPGDLYKCPHFYCMFTTNVRTLLTCHLKAHKCDSAIMVPCVYCDKKTPWEHVPMHIDIRHSCCKYSCFYCLYRAVLKEYVILHQEQCHPDLDHIVVALPPHKASKKFSVADSKSDYYRSLCEPFRCICKAKEGIEPEVHEYLFETEFVNHLNTAHPNEFICCGFPNCAQEINTYMMLNHWAGFHGICTYQCGYCKTSSKDISRMYSHFSQLHPSMAPDILVRKNDFLPQDRELRFSDDAFNLLGHIRKVPTTILTGIGNRTQRKLKLVQLNAPIRTSEDSNAASKVENSTSGIIPSGSLLIKSQATSHNAPVTQSSPSPLRISNPNFKLIVATTSGSNEKLYLVPTSMVSPPKGRSVTTTAPISKLTVQTTTPSKSVLNRTETTPREPVKIGDITIYPSDGSEIDLPTPRSSISTTSSLPVLSDSSVTMLSTPSLSPSVVISSAEPEGPSLSTEITDVEDVLSAKDPALTARIISISKLDTVSSTNNESTKESGPPGALFQDDLNSENDSTVVSEDDMLQSAIQSILDQDDDSNNSNTRLGSNFINKSASESSASKKISSSGTPSPLLSGIILDPPPLVLITNNPPTTKTSSDQVENEQAPDNVAPVEHVELAGNVSEGPATPQDEDPLNLGLNEDSNNLEIPFLHDNDPFSDDPLTITLDLNSDLSPGDPLSIDETVAVNDPLELNTIEPEVPAISSAKAETSRDPQKIVAMQRSVSIASTSDDESDSSNAEKKKRGLIGYQLYRCAACNLSFSNVKPFKLHFSSSLQCRNLGQKAFQCVHCDRVLKTPQRLAEHIVTHGVQRFSCSLCSEKFTSVGITKLHMKNRHSVHHTSLIPLKADRNNMDIDDFVIKPCQANSPIVKDKESVLDNPKMSGEDCTYTPDQIETIPIRQIFSTNVKCGLCNYQTKVRVNIIRHLQMHLDEKAVSDIAPVNPVPCLEKNEKMFDKMINLAASSVSTSGRMGGTVKEKEEEKYPEFIPTHRRFVCCAQGCSYLCPEEGNLKHHLVALHSDESNFTCAHCKVNIEPIDIENVIKHFKLHGLHLHKCQYCSFVHYLKHKVERHVVDGHLDMAVKVVTIRSMESEPQDFPAQEEATAIPEPPILSKFKPWGCCMCKAKYYTRAEVQSHITKKHNMDTQYKCALCAFKNDQEDNCREHFTEKHPNHAFDIISVYQKIEEEIPKDDTNAPFDTTPLWQRDKPRVRHIRGILFDDSSPQPSKSPKKQKTYGAPAKTSVASTTKVLGSTSTSVTPKTTPNTSSVTSRSTPSASTSATPKTTPTTSASTVVKSTPGISTSSTAKTSTSSKNLFDCIDAVARGVAGALDRPGSSGLSYTKKGPGSSFVAQEKSSAAVSSTTQASATNEPPSQKGNVSVDINKTHVADDSANDDVVLLPPESPSIIVIDSDDSDTESKLKCDERMAKDDDTPKSKDKDSKTRPMAKNRTVKRPGTDLLREAVKMAKIEETDDEDFVMASCCSQQSLIKAYGGFGSPHNKQWKCPKCNLFKSKRVGDFMFHLYKDFNLYRYRCGVCSDLSITYKYMQDHMRLHPGYSEDVIEALPSNFKLDTWIHMVIREQSLTILKNAPLFRKRPLTGPTDITCYFCTEKFMSMPECCEHMLYHWVMMPYQCQHCSHEFYTVYDLKHHHKIEHPDAKMYLDPKGPTLSKAVQSIEIRKKPPPKSQLDTTLAKKPRTDDNSNGNKEKKEEHITSGTVINTYRGKKPSKPTSSPNVPQNDVDIITVDDDGDDLVIVTKTDDKVPNEDDVFACDVCVFVADTEMSVIIHLLDQHQVKTRRYHVLSKRKSELDSTQKVACNICEDTFTELKLRRHFLENHFEGQVYAPFRFKCGLCAAKFLTPSRLKMHFTRLHKSEKLQYTQCGRPTAHNAYGARTSQFKQFFCPLCTYKTVSTSTISIRSHLKGHLKPVLCNHCNMRFRYHGELYSHTAKEHAESEASFTLLDEVVKAFTDNLKIINENAVLVPETSEQVAFVPSNPLNNVARKSTATPFVPPVTRAPNMSEHYDLSEITTTFELDALEYTTSAEEMMKMINMDTYVDMSDLAENGMPLNQS